MILRMPILVALFTVGAVAHATALSFKDISGKWCSEAGDYNFRPDMLIAKFHDRTPTRRLKVSDYDYRDDKIVMYWFWKGRSCIRNSANSAPTAARWHSRKARADRAGCFVAVDCRQRVAARTNQTFFKLS